jgi:hypothetical protein
MRAWFLFAILAFLVFGVPLIDELYRIRIRRKTNRLQPTTDETISLVPEMNAEVSTNSRAGAPAVRTLENV